MKQAVNTQQKSFFIKSASPALFLRHIVRKITRLFHLTFEKGHSSPKDSNKKCNGHSPLSIAGD
ncbi:MAG: hypothetical protein ACI309_06325, partial [Candidatus Limisoma sp.]